MHIYAYGSKLITVQLILTIGFIRRSVQNLTVFKVDGLFIVV